MNNLQDTIAAISTPLGEGGISVIRISGSGAFKTAGGIFSGTKDGKRKTDFGSVETHTIHYGYCFDDAELIDEVLVSVFKNPNSYTGEDVIEISSHGGVLVTKKVLGAVLKNGARHAEPGEFTKRAFLNGKIDLSKAEAVADLIKAKTDEAHRSSVSQLEGSLSEYVNGLRDELIGITALVELELDFAEEDVEFTGKEELKRKCASTVKNLEEIISSYISGRIVREGVNVVIAGKPNSGKSSLFNALLKSDRAIVSSISGTTRDFLEENLIIDGVLFNLTDTAGLRMTEDVIETEGIRRANEKIESSDLVLYLADSSDSPDELAASVDFYRRGIEGKNSVLVFTKSDISARGFSESKLSDGNIVINIKDSGSISLLKKEMVRRVREASEPAGKSGILLTNLRHKLCLEETAAALRNVIASVNSNMSGEYISVDLRNALNRLGEITGAVTNDDILNYIFSKFCIGK